MYPSAFPFDHLSNSLQILNKLSRILLPFPQLLLYIVYTSNWLSWSCLFQKSCLIKLPVASEFTIISFQFSLRCIYWVFTMWKISCKAMFGNKNTNLGKHLLQVAYNFCCIWLFQTRFFLICSFILIRQESAMVPG